MGDFIVTKTNRAELRSRLRATGAINGVSLPMKPVIGYQDFHAVAIARGWLKRYGADALEQRYSLGANVLRQATTDAEADIAALGYPASRDAIAGYLGQFNRWFFHDVSPKDLASATLKAEQVAPAGLLALLPRRSDGRCGRAHRGDLLLSPDLHDQWQMEVQAIVRAGIMHSRAREARREFFRLTKSEGLPSRTVFLDLLNSRLRLRLARRDLRRTAAVEQLVGACVADSSRWRLKSLRWELELADMELEPLGSYLAKSRAPRGLRVWYAIDVRLRHLLGHSLTNYAISRAFAAAQKVYAGPDLRPTGQVESVARDSVEKLRKRIPPDIASDVAAQLELEHTRIELKEDGVGWELTFVSPSGERRVVSIGPPRM
jgi:hypothetical protein